MDLKNSKIKHRAELVLLVALIAVFCLIVMFLKIKSG
jgi:hypothetical protein